MVTDDAPFEELLSLRESRADELEAFRVGLAELATQVDLTQWREDYELQAHDLIVRRVDPVVRDLQKSLKSSRPGALSKIWLAGTTVAVGLSYAAGAPLDLIAAMGLLGTAVPMLEATSQRKKLLHASQWSILLGPSGG